MKRWTSLGAVPLLVALNVSAPVYAVTRVSIASGGQQGDLSSGFPALSGDGGFVAFQSEATTLVPGDGNNAGDVFIHDRTNRTTARVSLNSAGEEANESSGSPAISADGRFVAFTSSASNIVVGDTSTPFSPDVFVRDTHTGTTTRVNVGPGNTQANDGSRSPSLSSDGRFVVFESDADNLVSGDTNATTDIFVHDRLSGLTERVSIASDGAQADEFSEQPSISADGRYVAFQSLATNLVPELGVSILGLHVYVKDRSTGTTIMAAPESNGSDENPRISADGQVVAFQTDATTLGPRDGLFVFLTQTRTTAFVTPRVYFGFDYRDRPSISGDGTVVVFYGSIGDEFSDEYGVVMHDRRLDVTTDVSSGGFDPVVSADGRIVAFASGRDDLVSGDSNEAVDIFVIGDGQSPGPGSRCGDGVIGSGELCDDGNRVDGDGCDNTCTPTPTSHCSVPMQCAAALSSVLPRPETATSRRARKAARALTAMSTRVGTLLGKADGAPSENKRRRAYRRAREVLLRMLTRARAFDAQGRLDAPIALIEERVEALLARIPA